MSTKKNKKTRNEQPGPGGLNLSAIDILLTEPESKGLSGYVRKHWAKAAVCLLILLLCIGVFAKKGWLPHTDNLTGKRTGWFGSDLPKNATTAWNPLAISFTTPTPPQLSKEYIYAGSRLLAVADANANATTAMDLAVWRPSTGAWIIFDGDSTEPAPSATLGHSGDIPVQGDFDGDGKTDFAVFRSSEGRTYIIQSSDNASSSVQLGASGDVPVAADHDGDGKTDVVLWTASNHDWKVAESSTNAVSETIFAGVVNDKPIPCDFDGDEKADTAYWRNSDHLFVSKDSADGEDKITPLGASGDMPVCADYDGDGKDDPAVFRNSTATWLIKQSSGETIAVQYGSPGDTPIPNDYDDDGKVDIAVWHPVAVTTTAFWYILQSRDQTTRSEMFGRPGDIPVPANYRR